MLIMECRLQNLKYVFDGLLKTNIPIIGWNGKSLIPFLAADDMGIYVLIPKLATFLGISLPIATSLFFYTIMFLSAFLGFLGLFLLYNKATTIFFTGIQLLFLLYFMINHNVGEVYLAYFAASIGLIPLFIYFYKNNYSSSLYFYLLFLGCSAGILHYIRSFSCLGTLLFTTFMVIMHPLSSYKQKTLHLVFLLCGLALPVFYFQKVAKTYTAYAYQHIPNYRDIPTVHPFWHNIYLGFGFLNFENKNNIKMNDEYAFEKAKEVNPDVLFPSAQYESIIKNKIVSLCTSKLSFIIFTLFAKLGLLLLYLLLFCNIGLVAFFFRSNKDWCLEAAFALSFLINSAFPLLTNPCFAYSIGFIALATLYGIVNCNELLLNNQKTKIVKEKLVTQTGF